MKIRTVKGGLCVAASAFALNFGFNAYAETVEDDQPALVATDEIVVIGQGRTYSSNATTEGMSLQQAPITSVVDQIDNLPGVLVSEGDAFGSDDWSTTISLRGFQTNLSEQQIGTTIDGLPNGNSGYGGGAKANRYIDSPNLGGVEVSQGTADIASRSLEALGGTLNFRTNDPEEEQRMRLMVAAGSFKSQKYYGRFDTGEVLPGTFAYMSVSHQENTDWVNQAGTSYRDHAAGKFISHQGTTDITGYVSYDDTHELNYQSISPAEFAIDPAWDRLTAEWGPNAYVNQLYRPAWGTLRKNIFGYLKADSKLTDNLEVTGAVYGHKLSGRGDWVPPYIVSLADDAGGPESELLVQRHGGAPYPWVVFPGPTPAQNVTSTSITFVDANGVALSPDPTCASSITFPYGGASSFFDPACYPSNAIPLQSYRHTHYQQHRYGFTGDFTWNMDLGAFDNTLRGGVWYEHNMRSESRDWHQLIDATVGPNYDYTAYWVQYSREYPYNTFMYYAEDSVNVGPVTARFGVKQFLIDLERHDLFGDTPNVSLNSDSDLLLSGGLTWALPIDGLEAFAGYSENFSAIKDGILEAGSTAISDIKPETARNIDYGMRFKYSNFVGSVTGYNIKFDNRVTFVPATIGSGAPDYLFESAGAYTNIGGIKSTGVEVAGTWRFNDNLSLYGSFTKNNSKYVGTGDAAGDAALGIYVGNKVRGALDKAFVASADWNSGPYFAGFSYKWVGAIWLDEANTTQLDSFGVGDFYAGVHGDGISDMLKGVDMRVVVNNMFDASYQAGVVGDGTAYIGAPRAFVFTVTADF